MKLGSKLVAEFIGTFWLVLGGCGAAAFAAVLTKSVDGGGAFNIGLGYLGVSLAFGLTVVTMAYAIGHISGCHLNPAVTIGLYAGGRFEKGYIVPYIVAQVLGGLFAGFLLFIILQGNPDWSGGAIAANGYGASGSPHGYSFLACLITEIVMTFMFLIVILGATDKRAPAALAPLAIGLCLTLIHLISIPITNTSVNPARSTGVALFSGATPIMQLWMFWLAPIVGAIAAGIVYQMFFEAEETDTAEAAATDAATA